jgi:Reverse transcriptase (RNA-dependent DNA polymerase)
MVMGLDICRKLPLTVTLDGQTIFKGFKEIKSFYASPLVVVGKGINFVDGSDKERTQVLEVLITHKEAIFEWSGRYGLFANHVIETPTTGGPIVSRAFRMNKHKRDMTEGIIKEYLERNIIEHSTSQWNATAFLVKKQCGEEEKRASKKWRMAEDYRELNKIIIDEVFDTPSVSEIVDIIGSENKYYCLIDLRQGYHHLPLKVSDREKSTFSTRGLAGKLQYRVLPYGLKHGGQVFQRAMERVLEGLLEKHCLVYVDDVLIFGKTFNHMLESLDLVLGRINKDRGSIDLGKSRFLAEEIDFLGHRIGKNGIQPMEKDIKPIINYIKP